MADDEQFSLCWNNFNSNLSAGFHESLVRGDLVDVTLAAEGQFVKAHRLVLSVCSPYFRRMFTQMPANQHAFVFLKDVSHTALKDLIQFMYCGEVNVKQEALPAFISTAEALQIKGLTDSDPPPPQSPVKPSTPAPQPPPIQQMTSPRVRHRSSNSRSYKLESIDDLGDDNKPTTQIVIQTTTAPQQTIVQQTHQQQQQQQQHHQTQQVQQQQHTTSNIVTTTSAAPTHKRPAQRSIVSATTKRTKSTILDPLEAADNTSPSSQQISVQTVVADTKPMQQQLQQQQQQHQQQQHQQAQSEPEFIDLPIELPTKSEPDYAEESGEVETAEQETTYVEDDSYGDMRYDESYFTENEDGGNTTTVSANISGGAGATTSKALVKQQAFSDSSYAEASDPTNNEAQGGDVKFIRSQKKNAQLVYNGYIYNKKLTQANGHTTWRCIDVLKLRCKAVVITKKNNLVVARREHNHVDHMSRIGQRPLYNVEEELGDFIGIKVDDPKLEEYITVSHIDINTHKSGKEFKIFMPAPHRGLDLKAHHHHATTL